MQVEPFNNVALERLGAGERAAIMLALSIDADLILIDERKGTTAALAKGFDVAGTLGVLALAARRGLVDLRDSFSRLKRTNFSLSPGDHGRVAEAARDLEPACMRCLDAR